ncbi:MAG: ATP synthase F0 subunit A [Candidatus Woykebacteria bacterium RBG_16_44_10]|uniref:ATP synthase subunit a n=1 Tax=Candidatus Woykebacteria bacterium RBG_16_44_10 TaxID=1802597 RepID=A0A1G1WEP7_9BACT|nr:MAG: ATP synthase F0 subunit A [Candidatus Woykebacteria bacterium RBG_16_44_10]
MEVTLFAEKIFQIGALPVTNTLLTTLAATSLLTIFAIVVSKKIAIIPISKLQIVSEIVIETIFTTIEGLSDKKRAERFFPLIATFFIFIITANYLGLLPGFNTIGINEMHGGEHVFVPLLRSVNSDLNVTLALALISVGMTHFYSISTVGIVNYLRRYFSLNPVNLFVGLLEIVAEFTKILSLSFRLFGNIFAGEALLVTISSLFAFVLPLPFIFLEIIVGFVQAVIFMMLTLVFMVILTEKSASH